MNKKENKSGVGIYIFLFLAVTLIAYLSISGLTKTGKEQRYNEKMEEILKVAKDYGVLIQDKLSSKCYEITIKDLIDKNLVIPDKNGIVYDPRNSESMNAKKICITYENNQIITYEKK